MKSSVKKLIASIGFLIVSFVLVVSASYAWFSISSNPGVSGITFSVGGNQTIQIASDVSIVKDGQVLHYPGEFGETLSILQSEEYKYLNNLSGLLPISTADGLHWFSPKDGIAESERTLNDYEIDTTLSLANLPAGENADKKGHYIYLDFWVVAPMETCELRLATGTDGKGSYVISLPELDLSGNEEVRLNTEGGEAANSVRIGFMTNTDTLMNGSMEAYIDSNHYSEKYARLAGVYPEKEINHKDFPIQKFTIYEPNGNAHTGVGASFIQTRSGSRIVNSEDGVYQETMPIGCADDTTILADISDRLIVQKKNEWIKSGNGSSLINEIFQGYILRNAENEDVDEELLKDFYLESIQGQFSPYIIPGLFYRNTENLYAFGDGDLVGETTAIEEAVLVELEKNVPQRIRMYVWLEGQDVDCVREAALEAFAVGLELAGSTE